MVPNPPLFPPEAPPATRPHPAAGCWCALHGRRLFTGLLVGGGAALAAGPAWAQDPSLGGLHGDVKRPSSTTRALMRLVPADKLEAAAGQQYQRMLQEAKAKNALAPADHPQMQRLRAIAERIIPHTRPWNGRAAAWRWEVNLIGSDQVNAFCMPGGKIAFYFGILSKLQLNDDEVAMIMGHEAAHALREHARERIAKDNGTQIGVAGLSAVLGLGGLGQTVLSAGGQLLSLRFSREDETEADLVGLDLGARAGYDPAAGVTLWQKMMAGSQGAPPQWMSTHPAGETRIRDIQGKLPKVQPVFARAAKPPQRFAAPQRKG
jgi:predicted Zn-dependent protease